MAVLLAAGGCAYSSDDIFPSLYVSDEQEAAAKADYDKDAVPELGSTNFEPVKISDGSSTGTLVGQKVITFRNELNQLQTSIRSNNSTLQQIRASVTNNAVQYHKVTGAIEAKLQVGTTPGNPQMFSMLETAQNNIQVMSANTNALNQLSGKVAADAANTDFLVNAIRASYSISGAVDEDHRQLHVLENEAAQTSVLMNSLLNEINSDIARQKQYVNTANNTIVNLSSAIKTGSFGVNNVPMTMPFVGGAGNRFGSSAPTATPAVSGSGAPLFVARFNKANVKYKDGLKQAVQAAQAKKPNVIFDVVAVNPTTGSAAVARNHAGQIFQDMIDMGVSADHINLSAKSGGESSEVRIYVH